MANGLGTRVLGLFLDQMFNNGAGLESITSIYISCHTADPGEDGLGPLDVANEVFIPGSGAATTAQYARQPLSCTTTDWDAATGEPPSVSNGAAIEYSEAVGSWGTVSHIGLWTTLEGVTESVYLGRCTLSTSKAVSDGETLSFAIGDITMASDETVDV